LKWSEPFMWLLSLPEVMTGCGSPIAFAACATATITASIFGCSWPIFTAALFTATPLAAATALPSIDSAAAAGGGGGVGAGVGAGVAAAGAAVPNIASALARSLG